LPTVIDTGRCQCHHDRGLPGVWCSRKQWHPAALWLCLRLYDDDEKLLILALPLSDSLAALCGYQSTSRVCIRGGWRRDLLVAPVPIADEPRE